MADRLTKVVAAVIDRNGKYLVGQRPSHKHHGGLWEFPGGKIQKNETATAAIRRELREELALDFIGVGKTVAMLTDGIIQIQFLFVNIKDHPVAMEHSELRWCKPTELADLELAPIDNNFVVNFLQPGNREPK